MTTTIITLELTQKQAEDLKEIREKFDVYEMHSELDSIFNYCLRGMRDHIHAEDAASDHYTFSCAKNLVAILLKNLNN